MQELGVIGGFRRAWAPVPGRDQTVHEKRRRQSEGSPNKAARMCLKSGNGPLNKLTDGMMIKDRGNNRAGARSVCQPPSALDEITQSLSMNNRNKLYELINKLKSMGCSVIVITHDVEELIRITDTITVLRDGEVVGDLVSANTTPDEIKHMMVGREISGEYYRADMVPDYGDDIVLSVSDLTVPGEIETSRRART